MLACSPQTSWSMTKYYFINWQPGLPCLREPPYLKILTSIIGNQTVFIMRRILFIIMTRESTRRQFSRYLARAGNITVMIYGRQYHHRPYRYMISKYYFIDAIALCEEAVDIGWLENSNDMSSTHWSEIITGGVKRNENRQRPLFIPIYKYGNNSINKS